MTPEKLKEAGAPFFDIIQKCEREHQFIREAQLRLWKKGEYYFEGEQMIYWDSTAQDYRSVTDAPISNAGLRELDPAVDDYYSKVMNIYRAHGESVIAVLSNEKPGVQFFPDDAESAEDVSTARNFSKVVPLIEKHNKSIYMQMYALYLLWTQGFLAGYTYTDASHKYGSVKKVKNKIVKQKQTLHFCPECDNEIEVNLAALEPDSGIPEATGIAPEGEPEVPNPFSGDFAGEFQANAGNMGGGGEIGNPILQQPQELEPDVSEGGLGREAGYPNEEGFSGPVGKCDVCGYNGPTKVEDAVIEEEVFDKYVYEPKCRTVCKVYGGTHVKVSPYAQEQSDCGYLVLEVEAPLERMRAKYSKILTDASPGPASDSTVERTARDIPRFEDMTSDNVTVKHVWLRPWQFYKNSVEEGDELSNKYPKGSYACYVGNICCEVREEAMDDHWTLSRSPLSQRIHASPLGKPMFDIQDIQNENLNLTLHKIEQSIEDTFADPTVLDFDKFEQVERTPGMVFPAKPAPGQSLNQAFHTLKGATISQEIGVFSDKLDQYGQMLVGAMPSVWGGVAEGGSKTAAEYESSKQQALQRLNISWKFLNIWWADFMHCAVKNYVADMQEVENYVIRQGDSYTNIKLMKDAMRGRIGRVEPESSTSFPLSWAEKRSSILDLIRMNNDEINEALFAPENMETIRELSGIPNLTLPGANSRLKQLREIQEIIASGKPPVEGMEEGQITSTISVDPELDDHRVEGEVVRNFLISDIGQDLKKDNEAVYLNLLAHFREHQKIIQERIAASQQTQTQPQPANQES